jgi:hypothetical protein
MFEPRRAGFPAVFADRIWISREEVGLAGVLQPDMFDVRRLRHYAQTSGRFRRLAGASMLGATRAC